MKKFPFFVIIALAVFVLLASSPSAWAKQAPVEKNAVLCTPVVPPDAQLWKYPLASGPLSMTQIVDLGLRPVRLQYPFSGYNHHREVNSRCGGTWTLETIPPGEMVLVGRDGYVAYRASCGNRLTWIGKPKQAPVLPRSIAATPGPARPNWFWRWAMTPAWYRYWYTAVEVHANGGKVEVTAGDIHLTANGNAEVRILR